MKQTGKLGLNSYYILLVHLLQAFYFLLQLFVLQCADFDTFLQTFDILLLFSATHFSRHLHTITSHILSALALQYQ